jgi:hypothetical protein
VTSVLARRLGKLEAVQRATAQRRFDEAVTALRRTMAPEHRDVIVDWMRERFGVTFRLPAGGSWYAILEEHQPPALVRAAWLLVAEHLLSGAPVSLAPSVAEVYLNDPEAYPMASCERCGYLMPTRSKIRPDGSFRHIGWYLGECPVCGVDNHPEEEAAS